MSRKKMLDEEKKTRLTLKINDNLLHEFDNLLKLDDKKRSTKIEELLQEYINKQNNE
jgi:metal-responsive CopG/Arc/MetJ family transcriptional regulator